MGRGPGTAGSLSGFVTTRESGHHFVGRRDRDTRTRDITSCDGAG